MSRATTACRLGSYLITTAAEGKPQLLVAGLAVLIAIVVALDFLVWRPLTLWAERFKYDVGGGGGQMLPAEARFRFAWGDWLDPARLGRLGRPVQWVWAPADWAVRGVVFVLSWVLALLYRPISSPLGRRVVGFLKFALPIVLLAFVGYTGFRALLWVSSNPLPRDAADIPKALLLSTFRLLVALAIALAWAVPVAAYLFHRPRASRFWVPTFQVLASVPVTAMFPVLTALLLRFSWGMEATAVVLLLTGMQWYLLFNVLAGMSQIPDEMVETMRSVGASRSLYWRKLTDPRDAAVARHGLPRGVGWGLERDHPVRVDGLRGQALLRRRAGVPHEARSERSGDTGLLVLTLIVMVGFILLVNRFVWRPAYEITTRRYRMEF